MVLHAHGFSEGAHTCYVAAALLDSKNPKCPTAGTLTHHETGGPERATSFEWPPGSAHLIHGPTRLAEVLRDLVALDEPASSTERCLRSTNMIRMLK